MKFVSTTSTVSSRRSAYGEKAEVGQTESLNTAYKGTEFNCKIEVYLGSVPLGIVYALCMYLLRTAYVSTGQVYMIYSLA